MVFICFILKLCEGGFFSIILLILIFYLCHYIFLSWRFPVFVLLSIFIFEVWITPIDVHLLFRDAILLVLLFLYFPGVPIHTCLPFLHSLTSQFLVGWYLSRSISWDCSRSYDLLVLPVTHLTFEVCIIQEVLEVHPLLRYFLVVINMGKSHLWFLSTIPFLWGGFLLC